MSALKTPGRPDEATLTVFPPEQPDFVNRCEYGDALNQGQEAEQSSARQLQAPVVSTMRHCVLWFFGHMVVCCSSVAHTVIILRFCMPIRGVCS